MLLRALSSFTIFDMNIMGLRVEPIGLPFPASSCFVSCKDAPDRTNIGRPNRTQHIACTPWARAVPIGLAVPTTVGSVTYPAHEVLWVPVGRGTVMFLTPFPIENGPKGQKNTLKLNFCPVKQPIQGK